MLRYRKLRAAASVGASTQLNEDHRFVSTKFRSLHKRKGHKNK